MSVLVRLTACVRWLLLQQKSALDIEREQEALLAKRYGGLAAKKKLMPKVGAAKVGTT